jgi:methionine aminopeptidase
MVSNIVDDADIDSYREALRIVKEVVDAAKEHLKKDQTSAAEFGKLLNLQLDLQKKVNADNIKEIECTWIDPEFLSAVEK